MDLHYLDKEEYKNIRLYKMHENMHGDMPYFIRRYTQSYGYTEIHRHEYMQINYVYQGKGKHLIHNQEFDIIKGDIFVIPPYIPHRIDPSPPEKAEIFEFEFEPEFVNQNFGKIEDVGSFIDFAYLEPFLVTESQVKPRLNLTGDLQIQVENILNDALKEDKERKQGFILMIKSLLLKLLVLVGRKFTETLSDSETSNIYDRHREAIYNVIKYIDENYSKELTLEEVAKVSMLSQSYFSYLFKSIISKTFIEYLNDLRISKAMEYLKKTDKRVLDICYDVGFNNVNHFNRLFRERTGVSPLVYRKMYK